MNRQAFPVAVAWLVGCAVGLTHTPSCRAGDVKRGLNIVFILANDEG